MLQDIRLALRRIRHAGGFSLAVVSILGLGIGAVTAMGSLLNALSFRTLALPDAGSLVGVSTVDARGGVRNTPLPALERLRDANLAVDGWCGYNSTLDALESGGRVDRGFGALMTAGCLDVVRVTPALGRWFTPDETPLTGPGRPVIVLTDRLWQRLFDSSPDAIGRQVRIQNTTVTVIGVMPPSYADFSSDYDFDFILPFNAHRPSTGATYFIGRLRSGATPAQVREQVRAFWPPMLDELMPAGPARDLLPELSGNAESVAGGFSVLRRLYAAPVQRLTVMALALFAIVCINVGGLMAARAAGRAAETATMRALGAGPTRIGRQFAIECGLYALGGCSVGVPLAYYGAGAFASLLPIGNAAWAMATTPDAYVIGASVMAAVVVSLATAAVPAWIAVRGSRQLLAVRTVAPGAGRWVQGMVVLQVAVTVALVFTGGLLLRSFHTLRTLDRGYNPDGLLSLRLSANPDGYAGLDAEVYYREMVDRVTAISGVQAAGLGRFFGTINARLPEQPVGFAGSSDTLASAVIDHASPGFFGALGTPLLAGRDLAWTDRPGTPPVAIVTESLARSLARDGDIIGRRIRVGTSKATVSLEVVGVVRNMSIGNVRETAVRMVYLPAVQARETTFLTLHVRTSGQPLGLAAPISDVIRAMGREHVTGAYAEDFLFMNSLIPERMGAVVTGGAAALALVISCIGVFAVLAHTVHRRTREIGIRMAVGAGAAAVAGLVLRQALTLAALGILLGLPAAVTATTLVKTMLYGVTDTDLTMMGLSATALLATAAIAAAHPTLRALHVDPSTALRTD